MKLHVLAAGIAALILSATGAMAGGKLHKLALHVDQNDPAVMNMTLNNADNVREYYAALGEEVKIEIVAYGPGLKMYTTDSPVKERIAAMSLEHQGEMQFSACGNTLRKMSEKAGKQVQLVSEAVVVPAGVVRLMELHEDGYNYIRP